MKFNLAKMKNIIGFVGRKQTLRDKMKVSTENTDHAKNNLSSEAASESHKFLLEKSINCLKTTGLSNVKIFKLMLKNVKFF